MDVEYNVVVELLDRNDPQLCLSGCSQQGTCITGRTDEYGSWLPPVCACAAGYAGNDCALKANRVQLDVDYESEVRRGTSMLVALPNLGSNRLDLEFTAELGQFDLYTRLWNEVLAADGSPFTQSGLYGDGPSLSPIPAPVSYGHHIQEYEHGSQRVTLRHEDQATFADEMTDYTLYLLITVPETSPTNGVLSFSLAASPGESVDWQLVVSAVCLAAVVLLFVACLCCLVAY